MIKSIIFDIGGVLAYDVWEHLLLDKETGIAYKHNLDLDKTREIGEKLWEEFAYRSTNDWKKLEEKYWTRFVSETGIEAPIDKFIETTDFFIKPIDKNNMFNLLKKLKYKEISLAICSNNNEFWFNRQYDKIKLNYFFSQKNIVLSCRSGASKLSPNFEMFKDVVKILGVQKNECIFIDDRPGPIEKANEYGITSILFPSHSSSGAIYLELLFKEMNIL